jgi:hypothetical protein
MISSRLLSVEYLEDRTAPAVFGLPWRDATHLSLSFAPDGTPIAAHQSLLFQTLNRSFPDPSDWQREIIRAFETWAVQANISVGLTTDSGDPFGIAGLMQHDDRFGDIRIGAQSMSSDVLSVSVPPDPFFAGTLAGDVFLNTDVTFTKNNLFPIMLHEAGHVFGLEDSSDPTSVMYSRLNQQTKLSSSDIQAIQALYGVRALDANGSNDSFTAATQIDYSGLTPVYTGTTPLVAYGDRSTATDVDYFWVKPLTGYIGPVTFQLQTSGISFLNPQLDVYDQNLNLLGEAQSTPVFGDTISVHLAANNPLAQRYYIRVSSPRNDLFGIGRYAVAVTFDNLVINPTALPAVLRGPYDTLSQADLSQILSNPGDAFFNNDFHTNDTFLTSEALTGRAGYPANTRYDHVASLIDNLDADVFRIQAPQAVTGTPLVVTITLTQMPINGVLPIVSVYDANTNPISADVLLNGNGTYAVQASNLVAGTTYYLKVVASPWASQKVGNYSLVVDFVGVAASLPTIASGSLSATNPQAQDNLFVARSQLFQFVLDVDSGGVTTDAQVRLDLFNAAGQLVFTLACPAGETVSGTSVFLTPGQYLMRLSVVSGSGGSVPLLHYRLRGMNLSDPIGPAQQDPTMNTMYRCPDDPSCYCYPDGTRSSTPYYSSSG